ncbi:hypothetical protein JQ597_04530 [Bradyrhizobium sp. AUGA SZCCT0177]|uniref:hypothetical protein n=1 Tax=Bradyrhizobium sp. AUGA SZCCT0177 TaxID=2807665 RepID=UPI001BAA5F9A|nr:hypothetical protein [Bradyrhizobium sp. AUGA SZCCT0177]MBR1281301.1 hypothetical protein [Bradyrhizobium sp. AUGA SZCCT0177]
MNTSLLFDAIKMAEEAGLEAQIGICKDMLVLNAIEFSKTVPGRVTHRASIVLFPDGTGAEEDLKEFAAGCAAFERRNRVGTRWFKFTSAHALTRWGYGTEEQARKYADFCGRGTKFVEVDGEPEDEGATITNIGVALAMA